MKKTHFLCTFTIINKTFCRKSFSVFNVAPPNTLKLFLGKKFYYLLVTFMKNLFLSLQDVFNKIMLVSFKKGEIVQ